MTTDDRAHAVAALLDETEQAHGTYETTELNGVYDQDWPRWYAAYAVDHGIGELLGHDVSTVALARLLVSAFADFKQTDPTPGEGWAGYTARRISAEL